MEEEEVFYPGSQPGPSGDQHRQMLVSNSVKGKGKEVHIVHDSDDEKNRTAAPLERAKLRTLDKQLKSERAEGSNRKKRPSGTQPFIPGRNTLDPSPTHRSSFKREERTISNGGPPSYLFTSTTSRIPTPLRDAVAHSRQALKDRTEPKPPDYAPYHMDSEHSRTKGDPPPTAVPPVRRQSRQLDPDMMAYPIPIERNRNNDPVLFASLHDSSSIRRGSTSPVKDSSTPLPLIRPTPRRPSATFTPHRAYGKDPQTSASSWDLSRQASSAEEYEQPEIVEQQSGRKNTSAAPPASGSSSRNHRGGFGSHGKKPLDYPVRGRANRSSGSVSPRKRRGAGSLAQPGAMLSYNQDDEDEASEPIENPDGIFQVEKNQDGNFFEVVPPPTNTEQSRAPDRGARYGSSPERATLNDRTTKRRPMQPKSPDNGKTAENKRNTRAGGISNGPIPSSNLNNHIAAVMMAWIPGSFQRVHIGTCSIEGHELALHAETSRNTMNCNMPFFSIKALDVCRGPRYPLMMITLDTSEARLAGCRNRLASMTGDLHPDQFERFQLIVAFHENSLEGRDLTVQLSDLLQDRKGTVSRLNDFAATDILQSYRDASASKGPSTRAVARSLKASKKEPEAQRAPVSEPRRPSRERSFEPVTRRKGRDSIGSEAPQAGSTKSKAKAKETDPTQPKLFFPAQRTETQSGTRRSRRQNAQQTYAELNSDGEQVGKPPDRPIVPDLPPGQRAEVLFCFPLQGRAEINISRGDRHRIKTNDFLNDTIIEFGLKHILSRLTSDVRDRLYLFNSFFYEKVAEKRYKPTPEGWPAYDSVKKWTKKENIFEKQFVIVPINEQYHWYLAVIYNPAAVLRERPPGDTPVNPHATRAQVSDGKQGLLDDDDLIHDDSIMQTEQKLTPPPHEGNTLPTGQGDSDLDELDSDNDRPKDEFVRECSPTVLAETDVIADMTADDPLDVLNQPEGTGLEDVQRRTRDLSIGSANVPTEVRGSSPGAPIRTDVMMMYEQQNQVGMEQVDPSSSPAKDETKLGIKPDSHIWESDQCWIITFDSLGGAHRAVHTVLNRWLHYEARDKGLLKGHDRPSDASYCEARVPQQPNFSDCGLYLIHYAEQLLNRPQEVIQFLQRSPPRISDNTRSGWEEDKQRVWHAAATGNLRESMLDIVDTLAAAYKDLHKNDKAKDGEEQNQSMTAPEASQDSIAVMPDFVPMPGAFPTDAAVPELQQEEQKRDLPSQNLREPSIDPDLFDRSSLQTSKWDAESRHTALPDDVPLQPDTLPVSDIQAEVTQPDPDGDSRLEEVDHDQQPLFQVIDTDPPGFGSSSGLVFDRANTQNFANSTPLSKQGVAMPRVTSPLDRLDDFLTRTPVRMRPPNTLHLNSSSSSRFAPTPSDTIMAPHEITDPSATSSQLGFDLDFRLRHGTTVPPALSIIPVDDRHSGEEIFESSPVEGGTHAMDMDGGTFDTDRNGIDDERLSIEHPTHVRFPENDTGENDEIPPSDSSRRKETSPLTPSTPLFRLGDEESESSSTSHKGKSLSPTTSAPKAPRKANVTTYSSSAKKGKKNAVKKRDLEADSTGVSPQTKKPRQSRPSSRQGTLTDQVKVSRKTPNNRKMVSEKGRRLDDPVELEESD